MDEFENNVDKESYQKYNSNNLSDVFNSDLEDNKNSSSNEPNNKKPKVGLKRFLLTILSIIGCIAVGLAVGVAIPITRSVIENGTEVKDAAESDKSFTDEQESDKKELGENTSPLSYASAANVELIKKVKPSVVCITSTVQTQGFFNMIYESEGSGSGIIFSKNANNAYIVTNSHVIEGAEKVSISIDSSTFVPAKLIGKDTNSDLAVISVSMTDLKAQGIDDVRVITFGDSDKVVPGASVIAIGNALGGGNTATSGVVSMVDKEIQVSGKQLTVIQTDAAINPGNSGGALINSNGEVVGINTAKLSTTNVEGVGYSITSNTAKPIIEKLMNNQNAPFLGVYISDISEEMASAYNLPRTGVMITQIIPNSSASASDLRETDIITGIDDTPIFTKEQLIETVGNYKIGDEIEIKIIRNGKTVKAVPVKLIANPSSDF